MENIELQRGPQRLAALSRATVILFGGAAGGGKSRWLVHDTARYFNRAEYGAVLFRRTYGELEGAGSLQEECKGLYPHLGGELVGHNWRFQSNATVELSHLQHEKNVSHWIGKSLCAVGFDEANQFEESMFWMLFSRLRTLSGIPTKFRMTTNPDPDSWLMEFVRWYLDESGFPDPAKMGKIRWFGRKQGKLMWYDHKADADKDRVPVTSFTFIPSKLSDNRILDTRDPEYRIKLLNMPLVESQRYLGGNWYARHSSGDYFQEAWFSRQVPKKEDIVRWFWTADLAATPVEGDQVAGAPRDTNTTPDRKDADYTILLLWGQDKKGNLSIWERYAWRDTPGAIEWGQVQAVKRATYARGAVMVHWQDPAQAGVHQANTYGKVFRGVCRYIVHPPLNPLQVATLGGRAAWNGKISVHPDLASAGAMFRWLQAFPDGSHDDDVSALGLGVLYADASPVPFISKTTGVNDQFRAAQNDIQLTNRFRELY